MRPQSAQRRFAPHAWLRLPRRTARLRLTLLYGGLFLLCGAALLAITYELVRNGAVERTDTPGAAFHLASPLHHPQPNLPTRRLPDIAGVQREVDLSHQLLWSAVALAIMAVLSIGLGWYVAGRVLSPVRTITRTARAISARNLGERLALDGPHDEFKDLGDTLDELLSRLQAAFESQRHFVANASHELRTPLTLERSLLQVALADPNPTIDSLQDTCRQALVASEQQQHLIEGLLTLASSESGLDHEELVDLSDLAAQVLLAPLTDIDRLELKVKTTLDTAPVEGDPRLLERLLSNLVENAARHNTPDGCIEITTNTSNGRAVVTVANTGAIIPAEELQRLFQPFQRLNGTRTRHYNGYGLGLSIVQAIAQAHDATLSADPHPEGGLTVELKFPAITDEPGPRHHADTETPTHKHV
jgi:signal transduction histidine kinase